jgi:hypothetical protein
VRVTPDIERWVGNRTRGRGATARAGKVISAFPCIARWSIVRLENPETYTRTTPDGRMTAPGRFRLRSIAARGGSEVGAVCPWPKGSEGLVAVGIPGKIIATSA